MLDKGSVDGKDVGCERKGEIKMDSNLVMLCALNMLLKQL